MLTVPHSVTRFICLCVAVSLVLPGPMAIADESVNSGIQDVELRESGVLTTRVVDLQGNPVVGEQVAIEYNGKQVASAVSDKDGLVAIGGLRPGLHSIVTPMGGTICRFWTADSAPPSAIRTPAVVSDAEVIRGQFGAFNLPMIVTTGVSIAAILIAINADNAADDAEDAAAALAQRVEALENASP
jgi:hypothetical protein